jgi:hypothetical protein
MFHELNSTIQYVNVIFLIFNMIEYYKKASLIQGVPVFYQQVKTVLKSGSSNRNSSNDMNCSNYGSFLQ